MKKEIKAAIKLLGDSGYNVTLVQGQQKIQLVRRRTIEDEPYWRYHINKYPKQYTPAAGEEIESCLLDVRELKWEGSAPREGK